MGAGLFDEFRELTELACRILDYDLEELCLRDPDKRLRSTVYAQPAILFVNVLHALRDRRQNPDAYAYSAGHSLGEYSALVFGGYLDLGDALALVRRRAELMAQVTGGGMAAVIGLPGTVVERALRETGLSEVYIANRNADVQTTIAGRSDELATAAKAIAALPGARVVRLNVSGPFHTPLMEPAGTAFAQILRDTEFTRGSVPVVSSVTGELFDPDDAVDLLSAQLAAPVEWIRTVRTLRAAGVTRFDEVNGRTMTALAEGIQ